MTDKPFAPACERNREPIRAVLANYLPGRRQVLEIGSGTGQHAVYFAAAFADLIWQTSDVAANLPGIRRWLADAALPNTPPPLLFDVKQSPTLGNYDVVFSANTLHIMSWGEVEQMFAGLPTYTTPDALLLIYGPFNDDGAFTSESNARFDAQLRQDHPQRGIRDRADVNRCAAAAGFVAVQNHAMPANNRLLVWRRASTV